MNIARSARLNNVYSFRNYGVPMEPPTQKRWYCGKDWSGHAIWSDDNDDYFEIDGEYILNTAQEVWRYFSKRYLQREMIGEVHELLGFDVEGNPVYTDDNYTYFDLDGDFVIADVADVHYFVKNTYDIVWTWEMAGGL